VYGIHSVTDTSEPGTVSSSSCDYSRVDGFCLLLYIPWNNFVSSVKCTPKQVRVHPQLKTHKQTKRNTDEASTFSLRNPVISLANRRRAVQRGGDTGPGWWCLLVARFEQRNGRGAGVPTHCTQSITHCINRVLLTIIYDRSFHTDRDMAGRPHDITPLGNPLCYRTCVRACVVDASGSLNSQVQWPTHSIHAYRTFIRLLSRFPLSVGA
jgi:hypothetical protein